MAETNDEMMACVERWEVIATAMLKGRRIVKARYMTEAEMKEHGWYNRAVVLELDNGSIIYPSSDDEGNNAGALFSRDVKGLGTTLPVI